MARLTLHIGGRKTGTTAIQNTLWKNRGLLAKQGIVYSEVTGHPNHEDFAAAFHGLLDRPAHRRLGITNESARETHRAAVLERLADEIASRPDADFIISSEQMLGEFLSAEGVGSMANALRPLFDDILVLCWLRNPVDYLVSSYSTELKTGRRNHRFRAGDAGKEPSLRSVLEPWRQNFGNTEFRYYRQDLLRDGDIVGEFAEAAGFSLPDGLEKGPGNPSLDLSKLEMLRLMNRNVPAFGRARHSDRRSVIRRLEALSSSDLKPRLKRETADELLRARWDDVEVIAELTGRPISMVAEVSCVANGAPSLEDYRLPSFSMEHVALDLQRIVMEDAG